MIIDTLLFNDEFDMLDIHLSITENYTDRWIILEASRTFSGLPKPYNLTNNIHRYKKKYGDRIEVINLELREDQKNLVCETMMRRGFRESLSKYDDNDIIIHGDLDEIINPEKWESIIALMEEHDKPVSCIFEMYFYKFNQQAGRSWKGSVVAKKRMFDTPHDLYKGDMAVVKRKNRNHCIGSDGHVGWHWTWMGNDNLIKNKVVSCIESQHRDPEQVLDAFKKVDTTSAINHKAGSEIVDPVYPDSVLQILKNYPDYWHNPMKKVLITGSEGYIGKHLIQMLGNKYDIYKLDLKDPTTSLDIRTVNWDLEFDTVVHLAALVNVSRSTKYPEDYFDTNVNGTRHLLKNLKYKNFVFASTGSAAGMASPYGISKKMAELVVEDYCKNQNKDFTMFRFYNVTGADGLPPTNPDGLFFSLMRAEKEGVFYLYGDDYNTRDGSCIRDYTHVNEICAALVKAIDIPANGLENLGHGVGTSVKEMVDIYKQVNNCDFKVQVMPRRPGDLETSVLDNVSTYMTKTYTMNDLMRKYDGTLLSEL